MTKTPKTINDLSPADYNPRRISDSAAGGLTASMQRFGDIAGITYNSRTGNLVAGHQRVEQLRKLGARLVTDGGLALERPDTGERWPMRVVDWPAADERAANIAANNPHIAGQFTADLQPLLQQVQTDIGETAFGELALEPLVSDTGAGEMPEIEDKDNPGAQQVTFIVTDEEKAHVDRALARARAVVGNEHGNINGACIAFICARFVDG